MLNLTSYTLFRRFLLFVYTFNYFHRRFLWWQHVKWRNWQRKCVTVISRKAIFLKHGWAPVLTLFENEGYLKHNATTYLYPSPVPAPSISSHVYFPPSLSHAYFSLIDVLFFMLFNVTFGLKWISIIIPFPQITKIKKAKGKITKYVSFDPFWKDIWAVFFILWASKVLLFTCH